MRVLSEEEQREEARLIRQLTDDKLRLAFLRERVSQNREELRRLYYHLHTVSACCQALLLHFSSGQGKKRRGRPPKNPLKNEGRPYCGRCGRWCDEATIPEPVAELPAESPSDTVALGATDPEPDSSEGRWEG
jgi:hypothetical protein